ASSSRSRSSTTSGRTDMSAQYDLNLQDYLRILRRRWKIVAGCCLALGALTLLLTPRVGSVYEATARVKWSRTDSVTGLFLEAFTWSPGDDLATQAQIITSRPVALKAAQRLGRIPVSTTIENVLADKTLSAALDAMLASYTAKPIDNTSLIEIHSACPGPDEAVELVNAVMQEYIIRHTFERNRQAIEAREFVERQVAEVSAKLRGAEEHLTRFKEANVGASMPDAKEVQYFQDEAARTEARLVALEHLDDLLAHPGDPGPSPELQRQVQVNSEAYEMLMRKHQEALIKEADKVQELSVVEEATAATPRHAPGRFLRSLVGLVVGVLLGLVAAFLAETLDTSIGS